MDPHSSFSTKYLNPAYSGLGPAFESNVAVDGFGPKSGLKDEHWRELTRLLSDADDAQLRGVRTKNDPQKDKVQDEKRSSGSRHEPVQKVTKTSTLKKFSAIKRQDSSATNSTPSGRISTSSISTAKAGNVVRSKGREQQQQRQKAEMLRQQQLLELQQHKIRQQQRAIAMSLARKEAAEAFQKSMAQSNQHKNSSYFGQLTRAGTYASASTFDRNGTTVSSAICRQNSMNTAMLIQETKSITSDGYSLSPKRSFGAGLFSKLSSGLSRSKSRMAPVEDKLVHDPLSGVSIHFEEDDQPPDSLFEDSFDGEGEEEEDANSFCEEDSPNYHPVADDHIEATSFIDSGSLGYNDGIDSNDMGSELNKPDHRHNWNKGGTNNDDIVRDEVQHVPCRASHATGHSAGHSADLSHSIDHDHGAKDRAGHSTGHSTGHIDRSSGDDDLMVGVEDKACNETIRNSPEPPRAVVYFQKNGRLIGRDIDNKFTPMTESRASVPFSDNSRKTDSTDRLGCITKPGASPPAPIDYIEIRLSPATKSTSRSVSRVLKGLWQKIRHYKKIIKGKDLRSGSGRLFVDISASTKMNHSGNSVATASSTSMSSIYERLLSAPSSAAESAYSHGSSGGETEYTADEYYRSVAKSATAKKVLTPALSGTLIRCYSNAVECVVRI